MAGNTNNPSGYESLSLPTLSPIKQTQQQTVQSVFTGQQGSVGVQGGQVKSGVVMPEPTATPSWGGVGDAVQRLLEPKLAAVQKQKFWEGVSDARGGKAIAEVANEESPLSAIFGPSSYLQGAQFYTAQASIAKFNQNMIENAPEFAKMTQQQIGQRLNAEAIQYETGDIGTDAIIHASWIEGTAPTMAVVAKTRYAQQQEAARIAVVANMQQNASLVQSLGAPLASGIASDTDMITAKQNMVKSWSQPFGMNQGTYREMMTGMARDFADNGNFHALNTLKDSPVLNFMEPEARVKLYDYTDRKAKEAAMKYRGQYSKELSDLHAALANDAMTPSDYNKQIDRMQREFEAKTGNREPLIPIMEYEGKLTAGRTNWYEAQKAAVVASRAANATAMTAAAKAAKEAKDADDATTYTLMGKAGEYVRLAGDARLVTQVMDQQWKSNPEKRVELLVSNYQNSAYVDPNIQTNIQAGFRAMSQESGNGYTPSMVQTIKQWKDLNATREGQATAAAYYTPEQTAQMTKFDGLVQSGYEPPVAFKKAFQDPLTKAVDWTAKFGMDKTIRGVVQDKFTSWFGTDTVDESDRRLVGDMINMHVGTLMANTNLTPEQAAYSAVNYLKGNGLEIVGGKAWQRGKDQRELASYIKGPNGMGGVGIVPETLDTVMRSVLTAKLKSAGLDKAETTQVLRMEDMNGEAQFAVIGMSKDGMTQRSQMFSSKDLSDEYDAQIIKRRVEAKPSTKEANGKEKARPFGIPGGYFPPSQYSYTNSK